MQIYWVPVCVFRRVFEYSTSVNVFNVAVIWGNKMTARSAFTSFVGFNLYRAHTVTQQSDLFFSFETANNALKENRNFSNSCIKMPTKYSTLFMLYQLAYFCLTNIIC